MAVNLEPLRTLDKAGFCGYDDFAMSGTQPLCRVTRDVTYCVHSRFNSPTRGEGRLKLPLTAPEFPWKHIERSEDL